MYLLLGVKIPIDLARDSFVPKFHAGLDPMVAVQADKFRIFKFFCGLKLLQLGFLDFSKYFGCWWPGDRVKEDRDRMVLEEAVGLDTILDHFNVLWIKFPVVLAGVDLVNTKKSVLEGNFFLIVRFCSVTRVFF